MKNATSICISMLATIMIMSCENDIWIRGNGNVVIEGTKKHI